MAGGIRSAAIMDLTDGRFQLIRCSMAPIRQMLSLTRADHAYNGYSKPICHFPDHTSHAPHPMMATNAVPLIMPRVLACVMNHSQKFRSRAITLSKMPDISRVSSSSFPEILTRSTRSQRSTRRRFNARNSLSIGVHTWLTLKLRYIDHV